MRSPTAIESFKLQIIPLTSQRKNQRCQSWWKIPVTEWKIETFTKLLQRCIRHVTHVYRSMYTGILGS